MELRADSSTCGMLVDTWRSERWSDGTGRSPDMDLRASYQGRLLRHVDGRSMLQYDPAAAADFAAVVLAGNRSSSPIQHHRHRPSYLAHHSSSALGGGHLHCTLQFCLTYRTLPFEACLCIPLPHLRRSAAARSDIVGKAVDSTAAGRWVAEGVADSSHCLCSFLHAETGSRSCNRLSIRNNIQHRSIGSGYSTIRSRDTG